MSAPASIAPRQDTKEEKEKVYNRQYSAPILKRKSSRFGLDGHVHSMSSAPATDDTNLSGFWHRVVDLEESDRETMHLLIFLLMQFLSRSDQAFPSDEKYQAKTQSIVLRHFYLLLGYNHNERGFHVPPNRLRQSPVFHVFLSNLPQLLDQNHLMGWMVIPTCVALLQYCPCPPQHNTPECQLHPTYSLWYLEPHTRRSWLMSLLVLLYKYQYSSQPLSTQLQALVKIVINTLDSQHHTCRRIPPTVVIAGLPSRSRDVSQPSLGVEGEKEVAVADTPPPSPMFSGGDGSIGHGSRGKATAVYYQKSPGSMETHWEEDDHSHKNKRHLEARYSTEAEETESELAVIPESKSDSTAQGSSQGSFEDDRGDDADGKKKDGSFKGPRPVWFLGSEDHSVQKSKGLSGMMAEKWGVKEGMKMLVTSSLFPVSPRPLIPTPQSDSSSKMKRESISPSETSPPLQHYQPPPLTLKPTLEKEVEYWPDNSLHGSPVPKGMSRGKRFTENSYTPTSTSSSTPTPTPTSHPPWQLDGNFKSPSYICQERLLPIGISTKPVSKTVRRQEETAAYCSPDSPLSKMDVITIESPQDSSQSDSSLPIPSITELEVPPHERLLQIGTSLPSLVQHVRQALGINALDTDRKVPSDQGPTRSPSDLDSLSYTKQDSFERSEPIQSSHSPHRLCKQVALESPPPTIDSETSFCRKAYQGKEEEKKDKSNRQKRKKQGLISIGNYFLAGRPNSWCGGHQQSLLNPATQQACHAAFGLKQSSFRVGDECVYERCGECGTIKEEYTDEELGLCIVILGTFIHREPALAAPMLPEVLSLVAKLGLSATYPWQCESNICLPGGAISVAHQFVRCVLQQLAPNGVFVQMFQTQVAETARIKFFRSVAQALIDFNELNPIAPLQHIVENLNSKKSLSMEQLPTMLQNMACYIDCLPLEAGLGPCCATWTTLLIHLGEFLRTKLVFVLHTLPDITPLLHLAVSVLRVPGVQSTKGIMESFSKILSYSIQNCTLKYHFLIDLCYLCNRSYAREREKLVLSRVAVFELVQALKSKTTIPDTNLLILVHFVLQDSGGMLPPSVASDDCLPPPFLEGSPLNTGAAECMRLHLNDLLEFLADFHALCKIKSLSKELTVGLNEDTMGGVLKCGIAQYVALELIRVNREGRETRALTRSLPWISLTAMAGSVQQGQKEFIECISHIRMMSWIILGSLMHTALFATPCLPIQPEASCLVSEHVLVIMAGFTEQPKATVLHMSSLFHTFVLCQLWTIYLEQIAGSSSLASDTHTNTMTILFDFWRKVIPSILQLSSHSKTLAEIVNLHFLTMMESLSDCNSATLNILLPIWSPVLFAHFVRLPGHLQLRLQGCRNLPPTVQTGPSQKNPAHNPHLLRWLQRLQFKMGQIELQSSSATRFYSI